MNDNQKKKHGVPSFPVISYIEYRRSLGDFNSMWKSISTSHLLKAIFFFSLRKRHFTAVKGQVGSPKSNGTVYRILRKQILQPESLVRIRTSRSLPKEGDPS